MRYYLQGLIIPRWCRISEINSSDVDLYIDILYICVACWDAPPFQHILGK